VELLWSYCGDTVELQWSYVGGKMDGFGSKSEDYSYIVGIIRENS
jgi:hypothetical protein